MALAVQGMADASKTLKSKAQHKKRAGACERSGSFCRPGRTGHKKAAHPDGGAS